MKIRSLVISALVVGGVTMGSAGPAFAGEATVYHARGNGAVASWYDSTSCSSYNTRVIVDELVTRQKGDGWVESAMVTVTGYIYDYCYGSANYGLNIYFAGVNVEESPVLYESTVLKTATLRATIPMNHYGSLGVFQGSASVDLTWTVTDDYFYKGVSTSPDRTPEYMFVWHHKGNTASAVVTGTVTLDDRVISLGIPTAEIYKSLDGSVTIIKNPTP